MDRGHKPWTIKGAGGPPSLSPRVAVCGSTHTSARAKGAGGRGGVGERALISSSRGHAKTPTQTGSCPDPFRSVGTARAPSLHGHDLSASRARRGGEFSWAFPSALSLPPLPLQLVPAQVIFWPLFLLPPTVPKGHGHRSCPGTRFGRAKAALVCLQWPVGTHVVVFWLPPCPSPGSAPFLLPYCLCASYPKTRRVTLQGKPRASEACRESARVRTLVGTSVCGGVPVSRPPGPPCSHDPPPFECIHHHTHPPLNPPYHHHSSLISLLNQP